MNGILSCTGPTGELLAQMLEVPFWRYFDMPENPGKVIRWGSLSRSEQTSLNSAAAIALSSNKAECRRVLRTGGVPVPTDVDITQFDGKNWSSTTKPIVGRPAKHARGRKFWYCDTGRKIDRAVRRGAAYWSEYYPKTAEYRVHIAGKRILFMSAKEGGDTSQHVWNHHGGGFTFRHMHRSEWLNDPNLFAMQKACKAAMKVVGLDFGAVDVMAGAGEGYAPFVICEINSAPSLSPLAAEHYVTYFKKWLGGK